MRCGQAEEVSWASRRLRAAPTCRSLGGLTGLRVCNNAWSQLTCQHPPAPHQCSQRRADEITALTDLDARTAAAVAAFFQRGGHPVQGLPGLGAAQLQSL